ncbi:hypothetical protein [Sphingomonas sanxanigenens]|uniref:Uncharacterized protein n=1 Tax=Sphingomonas sanxanigenens DSM 19645 = NX02 TaxID=1123269 RepID=W0ABU3_9SPHN|nr:hypothetical protein [Sphingomonas sanxanigenens]AHE54541.1 hypothetical protein NX02_14270 [Sphingomonas sanxanigenens DSM 19645 = NX02]
MTWSNSQDDLWFISYGADDDVEIYFSEIVERDDGFGGFNVEFKVRATGNRPLNNPSASYHVHFNGSSAGERNQLSATVTTIKYKGGAGPTSDRNIWKPADRATRRTARFRDLLQEVPLATWPRHRRLIERLSAAWNLYRGI